MQFKLFSTIRSGRQYSQLWPCQTELNSVFPENKVIRLTGLGFRFLPVLAVATALLQFHLLGMAFLPQILAMMLFLVTLPFQGLYWLGIRSQTPLPPSIASWFVEIRQKMQQQGIELPVVKQPGSYFDLARLLKQAYQQLDKAFIKEWL